MNVCIVSTFEGTTEDYMDMFNATKEKGQGFMQDYELGVIREGKVMLMMQRRNPEAHVRRVKRHTTHVQAEPGGACEAGQGAHNSSLIVRALTSNSRESSPGSAAATEPAAASAQESNSAKARKASWRVM